MKRAMLLWLLVASISPSYAQVPSRAEVPDVRVGDNWVIQNRNARTGELQQELDLTVTGVSDTSITTVSPDGQSRTYTREWNQVETKNGEAVTFSAKPSFQLLQFPIEVGRKWDVRWEQVTPRQFTKWQGQAVVKGVESVSVPAGTFNAFRIEFEASYNGEARGGGSSRWTGRRTQTIWYAPDAKRTVRSEFQERSGSYFNHEVNELRALKFSP